jgi:hypothetical protein
MRRRCERLIDQIVMREWRRKGEAYAADIDGKLTHDLPLLKSYEKVVGTDVTARKLFVEALGKAGPLLEQAAGERGPALEAFRTKCFQLNAPKGRLRIAGEEFAALLFISFVLNDEDTTREESASIADLFGNPGIREAVKDKETGEAFRRLLNAWAESRNAAQFRSRQHFIFLVQAIEFKEGLPVLRRWIQDKDIAKGHFLPMAVYVYGKVGGKDVAVDLEKLWGDETVLFMDGMTKVPLGDQALAASMRLAGKNPKDYGMVETQILAAGPGGLLAVPAHWFTSDENRRTGLKKWKKEADKPK